MTATENDPNMRQLQQLVRLTTQAARDNPLTLREDGDAPGNSGAPRPAGSGAQPAA